MAYVLNDKIKIEKPIVFLCGPYYNDSDKSDRRKILQDFFLSSFPNQCLPLIIDDFLTRENIGDDSVSIQLLEEIFAGISHKTYIFLDTMSSAVELGLFTNSAFNNSLYVMLPYEEERFCGSIGVFTKDVVLGENLGRVKTVSYHPRIERVAFSTDYVGEFYKFVYDRLPTVLKKDILKDYQTGLLPEYEIRLECEDSYPRDDFCVHYQYDKDENSLIVFTSVKLLFYAVSGVVYSEYSDNLLKKEDLDFNHYNIDIAVSHVKSIFINFVQKRTFLGINGKTEVSVQTVLARELEDVVRHIVTFIFTYHKNARLRGYYFVGKNEIVKELELKSNPTDLFRLGASDIGFITDTADMIGECFRTFEFRAGSKRREIVTYSEDADGKAMRQLHEAMTRALNRKHRFSNHSYAYRKGRSVLKCVQCHIDSVSFLKFDIHKFFQSIEKDKLMKKMIREFNVDSVYKDQLSLILDTCFYEGKMPVGLVTSPVLSDIYMSEFDEKFVRKLGNGYIYTRYADDILISSSDTISSGEEERIKALLQKMLGSLKLSLNEKKYQRRDEN